MRLADTLGLALLAWTVLGGVWLWTGERRLRRARRDFDEHTAAALLLVADDEQRER